MKSTELGLAVLAALAPLSCTPASAVQTPSPQPAPASTGQAAGTLPAPAGPAGATAQGPRRAPNPIAQDSARRAQVDSIMRTIAGREQEPSGTVFKNVKLLKQMPAGEFLKNMDVNYGRGLGMSCGNCHVLGKYDEDTRKNKRVAREMQEMTDYINSVRLAGIKELDEDYVKVTCVTCHAGSGHPKATMAVPAPVQSGNR
jgi:photosynthetic reaction center cytochrome c subunit